VPLRQHARVQDAYDQDPAFILAEEDGMPALLRAKIAGSKVVTGAPLRGAVGQRPTAFLQGAEIAGTLILSPRAVGVLGDLLKVRLCAAREAEGCLLACAGAPRWNRRRTDGSELLQSGWLWDVPDDGRRFVPLLISLGVAVFGSGALGTVAGFITTFQAIQELPADRQHAVTLMGIFELNNAAWAFIFIVLATLIASAGALRLALKSKATPAHPA
jgi:hypothetical protein